jgi:hypothetical protein
MKIPGIEASPLRNKLKSRNILNLEFSLCKKTAHELLYKIHTLAFMLVEKLVSLPVEACICVCRTKTK